METRTKQRQATLANFFSPQRSLFLHAIELPFFIDITALFSTVKYIWRDLFKSKQTSDGDSRTGMGWSRVSHTQAIFFQSIDKQYWSYQMKCREKRINKAARVFFKKIKRSMQKPRSQLFFCTGDSGENRFD